MKHRIIGSVQLLAAAAVLMAVSGCQSHHSCHSHQGCPDSRHSIYLPYSAGQQQPMAVTVATTRSTTVTTTVSTTTTTTASAAVRVSPATEATANDPYASYSCPRPCMPYSCVPQPTSCDPQPAPCNFQPTPRFTRGLIFNRDANVDPGLYSASDFAYRSSWPSTDAYYQRSPEVTYYRERFIDWQGPGHRNQISRRFEARSYGTVVR